MSEGTDQNPQAERGQASPPSRPLTPRLSGTVQSTPTRMPRRAGGPSRGEGPRLEERFEAANRTAKTVAVVVALLLGIAWVSARSLGRVGPGLAADAADYAQIGRHLARGEGFRTSMIRPISVGLGYSVDRAPEITRPPVFPCILAAAFRASGTSDTVVVWSSFAGLLLALGFVYLAAARFFDRGTGLLAVALVLFNPRLLEVAVGGTGSAWAAALVAAALYGASLLHRPQEADDEALSAPPRSRWGTVAPVLVGMAVGLAYLTEYAVLLVVLPVLWHVRALAAERDRRRVTLLLLAGFVVVLLPWCARNMLNVRSPLFTLDRYAAMMVTNEYPGTTAYRMAENPGNPYLFLLQHPRVPLANLVRCADGLYGALPLAVGPLVLIGALLLYLTPLKADADRPLRRTLGMSFLAVLVLTAATIPFTPVNYVPLIPLAAVVAAVAFTRLARSMTPWPRRLVWALLAGFLVVPTLALQRTAGAGDAWPTINNLKALAAEAPKDIIVITDVPQQVAWYLDRPAVWLPARQDDLKVIGEKYRQGPPAFLLSRGLRQWPRQEQAQDYQALLPAAKPPEGLVEVQLPTAGDRLFVPGQGQPAASSR